MYEYGLLRGLPTVVMNERGNVSRVVGGGVAAAVAASSSWSVSVCHEELGQKYVFGKHLDGIGPRITLHSCTIYFFS